MPRGRAFGVGAQLLDLRHDHQLLQQVVDAKVLLGRHLDHDRVAAPLLRDQPQLGELLHDALGVRVGAVDLVDSHDDRYICRLGVVQRLDRLGHDPVVSGHHEHDDVCDLGASGAHRGERLVAWRVDERYDGPRCRHDLVSTDVLGNAAGLAGSYVRLTDAVEESRLAMVDVAHDRNDGRPRAKELFLVVVVVLFAEVASLKLCLLLFTGIDEPYGGADLGGKKLDHVVGKRHRGRHHLALRQQETHDVCGATVQPRRQLLGRGTPFDDDFTLRHGGVRGHICRRCLGL